MKNIIINTFLTLFLFLVSLGYLLGAKPLIVTSNSMAPLLSKGDLIIVFKSKEYQIDDVISFRKKGKVVTHRLVVKEKNYFKTKGDANKSLDFGLVSHNDIFGKVEMIIPLLGFLLIYLQSKYFVYLLLIIGMYLLSGKIKNVKK